MQAGLTHCTLSHVSFPRNVAHHVPIVPPPRFSNARTFPTSHFFSRLPKRHSSMRLRCIAGENESPDLRAGARGLDEPHPEEVLAEKVATSASDVYAPSMVASLDELVLSKEGIVERLVELLAEESGPSAETARHLVARIDEKGRASLLTALFASASTSSDEYFAAADVNKDGVLDSQEFSNFVEMQAAKYGLLATPLTSKQIWLMGSRAAIGMLGFGFTDNFIMIIAGDAIQNTIGASLALSPLMSAGLGNAVADLVGTAFREYIEGLSSKLMPDSRVSPLQMEMSEAWWAETVGASVGVTAGCLLGLVPLLVLQEVGGVVTPPPLAALGFRTKGGGRFGGGEEEGGALLRVGGVGEAVGGERGGGGRTRWVENEGGLVVGGRGQRTVRTDEWGERGGIQ